MDWADYEIYDPGCWGPLQDLPRTEAREAFARLMQAKEDRIEQLRALLATDGVALAPDNGSIMWINEWLVDSIEAHPKKKTEPAGRWFSVVNDLALFLGDVLIARSSGRLRWEFFVGDRSTAGKANVSYQRHVLMGFTRANPKYCYDVDRMVADVARDALARSKKDRYSARTALVIRLAFAEKYM